MPLQPAHGRVLLVEDSSVDARMIREGLGRYEQCPHEIVEAARLAEAFEHLDKGRFEVVLLDLSLPDSLGLATLKAMRSRAAELPVVVLTGTDDEDIARRALELGAQDYLVKRSSNPEIVHRAVHYAVQRHAVLRELESTREQQVRLRDQFLSVVSHELRTPLNNLTLALGNVADGVVGELNPEQHEFLRLAQSNAGLLERMIVGILDVARVDSGELAITPAPTAIEQVLSEARAVMLPQAGQHGIELRLAVAASLPAVCADARRVRQVLVNLIDNALKFTPDGGAVTMTAAAAAGAADGVLVSITDTGRGISPAGLRRIFDRFYQEDASGDANHRAGLGLGLYLCKKLVNRMGGRIWAASQPGNGSAFFFTLPRCSHVGACCQTSEGALA